MSQQQREQELREQLEELELELSGAASESLRAALEQEAERLEFELCELRAEAEA